MGQKNSVHKTITVERLLRKCKTGDIIMFSGHSFFSCMVRCVSHSEPWSHIGMVYREKDKRPLLFESTYDEGKLKDRITKKLKTGLKLVDLEKRLYENCDSRMVYRELKQEKKDKNGV